MNRVVRLAITTGDSDGIGLEISVKSLMSIGPKSNIVYFLYRSKKVPPRHMKALDRRFKRVTVSSFEEYFERHSTSRYNLVDIASGDSPADWVVSASRLCLGKMFDGMTTAPLSKTSIRASGYKEIGHTELIRSLAKTAEPMMAFIGNRFNVILASGHIPLARVKITKARLYRAATIAIELRNLLAPKLRKKPIGLVGINPHAGEQGLIGSEESRVYAPVIKSFPKKERVIGPLVPDAAFLPQNWQKYSVYVCPYHDQGLIPFKAINRTSGVHLTMGIPFVRTSVDHGTAKDLYGKDKADASSMKSAIVLAIKLIRQRG